ncbi:TaqI-like C-terminal specificity domain-containing protein [Fibrobacter sp.]|uniref:TaqI-like C-terminal specificity domain-containing protein n=1 Tax=Fibrobacter sp. TaxID=35828 RepID=UPI0025C2E9F2|nr:TaqI-like C-terminal specificity domain-containing protein [Fibrobacter sp.]
MNFDSCESWVILSAIEHNIKEKIATIGVPLREWNITIYRGILTGFNDAFIISSETRKEILSKCANEDERKRTDAIIRPILRGRDIQRYNYEWADLYIIATLPSRHYDIEDYPSIKNYLLSFGMERLEQTGETHIINKEKIKSRKKTNNKWFETQDSISYWDDFNKPKIVWKRVGSILRFSYDNSGMMALDSTCFATGQHIEFLVALLNSKMGHYLLKDSPKTGTGDLLVSVQAIEPIKVPVPSESLEKKICSLLTEVIQKKNGSEAKLDELIYSMYNLEPNEIDFIEHQ